MLKKISLVIFLFSVLFTCDAQEIQARLSVLTSKISSQVDKKIFQTLQTGLVNFINNRKWSADTYQPNEKIQCNFLLNIDQELGNNVYKAKLTVQAARPVYNTSYDSPLINYIDDDDKLTGFIKSFEWSLSNDNDVVISNTIIDTIVDKKLIVSGENAEILYSRLFLFVFKGLYLFD